MASYEEYCKKRGIPFTPPEPPKVVLKVVIEDEPAPEKKPAAKKAPAKKKTSANKKPSKA